MNRITGIGLVLVAALAFGCGPSGNGAGGPAAKDPHGNALTDSKGNPITQEAANKFKQGLDLLTQHDKARDWDEASCTSTAQVFIDAVHRLPGVSPA